MFSHVALSDDCEHTVGSCVLAPLLWNKVSMSLPSLVDCVCVVIALAGDSSSFSSSASSSSTSALTLFDWWPFDTTISCNSCLQFSETSKITQWQLHFCLQRTQSQSYSRLDEAVWLCPPVVPRLRQVLQMGFQWVQCQLPTFHNVWNNSQLFLPWLSPKLASPIVWQLECDLILWFQKQIYSEEPSISARVRATRMTDLSGRFTSSDRNLHISLTADASFLCSRHVIVSPSKRPCACC